MMTRGQTALHGRGSFRMLLLFALALTLGFVVQACSASRPASRGAASPGEGTQTSVPTGDLTRTSEGGSVTVRVIWQGPQAGPVFAVALDTHSVDLDGYDLGQLAVLRTSSGQEVKPSSWEAPKGGHHRSGTLTFPDKGPDGKPVVGPDGKGLELVIRSVAGVPERVFRWES